MLGMQEQGPRQFGRLIEQPLLHAPVINCGSRIATGVAVNLPLQRNSGMGGELSLQIAAQVIIRVGWIFPAPHLGFDEVLEVAHFGNCSGGLMINVWAVSSINSFDIDAAEAILNRPGDQLFSTGKSQF